MTLRKKAPRAKVRWLGLGFAAAAMMLLIAGAVLGNLNGSNFEGNDGNLVVNTSGNTDWANVAGLNTGIDLTSGSSDNSFGQGTKEDNAAVTVVTGSIPPNKNDLTRFYEASQTVGGQTFLYLAWERAVNLGTANMDFEINQVATPGFTTGTTGAITLTRTVGDVLVTYDFSGSGTPTLGYRIWSGSAWGAPTALNATNSEGAVNTVVVTDPIAPGPRNLPIGTFGEAAINLTAAGIIPAGTCKTFGSTFLKSRSSTSFTAELKDFIAPVAVNINNCGTIKITKVTQNGEGTFAYTATGLTPTSFNLTNGQTQTYSDVPSGSSSVTEAAQVAPWNFVSLTCTDSGGASHSISGQTASITMVGGGEVDCTYTNHKTNSPTITTLLSSDSILNTGTVTDTATLSGATSDASGAITISRYSGTGSGACVAANLLETNPATPATNGNGAYTATFGPMAAGHYEFQAVIAADANNATASSVCGSEPLTVRNQPTLTTLLGSASILNTGTVTDTATLSGATSDASGAITIRRYSGTGSGACVAANLLETKTATPATNGNGDYTATFGPMAAGHYEFQAFIAADTKNLGANSVCGTEPLTVRNAPTVSTAQSLIPNDTLTLGGATADAGGHVDFYLFSPSQTCSVANEGTAAFSFLNIGLTNNVSASTNNSTAVTTVGTWHWLAVYSGDGTNDPATSLCTETFNITN